MIIYTSICANYLPKAAVLAKSVKNKVKDAIFILCLLEKEAHPFARSLKEIDDVVLANEIGFSNFHRFIFSHSIVEASTAVKAQFFKYLLVKYPDENKFVYLDPDIVVYSDFVELKNELDRNSIILCPHLLKPGNIEMELSSLKHGVYNLGFLAISRNAESEKFLDWWAERLLWWCYDDIPNGIFTDQKWVDLAPSFFNVKIFKHKGYDFATWSLKDSNVNVRNGNYYIDDDQLRFVHYSGFDSKTMDWAIKTWLPNYETNPFVPLYEKYQIDLQKNQQSSLGNEPWSYDYYKSGEKICKMSREVWRKYHGIQFRYEDPFNYSNLFFFFIFGGIKIKKYFEKILKILWKIF